MEEGSSFLFPLHFSGLCWYFENTFRDGYCCHRNATQCLVYGGSCFNWLANDSLRIFWAGGTILAPVVGKRLIYLISGIVMLVSAVLNMYVNSYVQFMASRIFQGVGWGAFEALTPISIRDLYFVSISPPCEAMKDS